MRPVVVGAVSSRSVLLPLTVVTAALLVLTGCGEDATPGVSPSTQSPAATVTTTAEPTSPASTGTPTDDGSSPPSPSSATALVLTVGGSATKIAPTDVYCTRSGDTIGHMIGKTANRPPLVEADGDDFVLVKLGNGAPYKAQRPSGVTYTADSVTFAKVTLGAATLDGTMVCTTFEG